METQNSDSSPLSPPSVKYQENNSEKLPEIKTGRLIFRRNVRELKAKKKEEERIETIKRCSLVVESMPSEVKEILTSSMGSIVITPQESFIGYFKDAIPKYDDEVFLIKFVEVFQSISEKALANLLKSKKKGKTMGNDDFWKHFEVLFDGMPNSYRKRESFTTRMKLLGMDIWQVLKMGKKLIFAI